MSELPRTEGAAPGLTDYLRILARRKALVLGAVVLVPVLALVLTVGQSPLYRGSAEVLLGQLDLAAGLTGIPALESNQPQRVATTQAGLARTPAVAERALRAAGVTATTPQQFLDSSAVSTQNDSDLLRFTVNDRNAGLATELAAAYARAYTAYRLELDTAAIQRARADIERRVAALRANGRHSGSLYESLVANGDKLRTMEALLSANASVVRSGEPAVKIRPQPQRTFVFGLALGLVLGVGLALLAEAFDTRVRDVDEIGRRLGLPLLARLPTRDRDLGGSGLVMLDDPVGGSAEAYRVLRANLDFVNAKHHARSIMVTSALVGEGKSETIANLAVAFAFAGRHVALVDLDLRHPTLGRRFALDGLPGLTDVAVGDVELDDALVPVPLTADPEKRSAGNGRQHLRRGTLVVLSAGSNLPEVGELAGTEVVGEIVRELRKRADLVLVDSPALLRVGDAVALSTHVDGLLVVTQLTTLRRHVLKELRRVLDASPTRKFGFVVTHAADELGYGYGQVAERDEPTLGTVVREHARWT